MTSPFCLAAVGWFCAWLAACGGSDTSSRADADDAAVTLDSTPASEFDAATDDDATDGADGADGDDATNTTDLTDGFDEADTSGTTDATDTTGTTDTTDTTDTDATGTTGTDTTGTDADATAPVPDPDATLHTPVFARDPTVPGTFRDRVGFLYTGADAVQRGADEAAFDPARLAVVHGLVTDRSGAPLAGIDVAIVGHPEHGHTTTRADGSYDLAVNGGGSLRVRFTGDGVLPVDRALVVPWNDWALVDTVAMTARDAHATAVAFGAAATTYQVAASTTVSDDDGARHVTILFPPGTQAALVMPDGSSQAADTLHIRATEYTVGASGPSAMPADLPPASAYTFAAELAADEGIAAGAAHVDFDRPVFVYVDNFLEIRTGVNVPVGFYEPDLGKWVASDNGRVIEVLQADGAATTIDGDGDGLADSPGQLAVLGLSDAERAEIGARFASGASVWRVPVTHFSTPDCNFPFAPPDDAAPPQVPPPEPPEHHDCDDASGSIIGCQSQLLGERIPIAGTPWALRYSSARAALPLDGALRIPVTDHTTPASVTRAEVVVTVGGRRFTQGFPATPGQTFAFAWDGNDAYGRPLRVSRAHVEVRYLYQPHYAETGLTQAFAKFGNVVGPTPSRNEIFMRASTDLTLGHAAAPAGLGGWDLDVHASYDPVARKLTRGDGSERDDAGDGARVIEPFGPGLSPNTGAPNITKMKVAPDGTLYAVVASLPVRIAHFTRNGTWEVITLPADPDVFSLEALALAPDGAILLAELHRSGSGSYGGRVRRRAPDGSVTVIAGGHGGPALEADRGDGGPATLAALDAPTSIDIGPDGTIYVGTARRVRAISPDGLIATLVGNGFGLGGPPDPEVVGDIPDVAVAPDGSVYVANASYVTRVDPAGRKSIFAGAGEGGVAVPSDGFVRATEAQIGAQSLAVGTDGSVFIGGDAFDDAGEPVTGVVRVFPDGMMTGFAGGRYSLPSVALYDYDNPAAPRPAFGVEFPGVWIATSPANALVVRIDGPYFIGASLQARSDHGFTVADGDRIDLFDGQGRHVRSDEPRTNAALVSFGYDAEGRIASVTDDGGLTTTITRSPDGQAITITSPAGQTTALALDASGWLASVTDPLGHFWRMTYDPTLPGLLTTFTDPRAATSTLAYDADGRLTSDTDAGAHTQTLTHTDLDPGERVVRRSAEGGVTRFTTVRDSTGVTHTTSHDAEGGAIVTTATRTQDDVTTTRTPDGVVVVSREAPDPRFGKAGQYVAARTTTLPSGLARSEAFTRRILLNDVADLTTLKTQTDRYASGSGSLTVAYDAQARTETRTSAGGRVLTRTLDAAGRTLHQEVAGFLPIDVAYDAGRLARVSQGARVWSATYSAATGELASASDPLGRSSVLARDAAGRVTGVTQPDGARVAFEADPLGTLVGLTDPAGSVTTFALDALGQVTAITPPALAGSGPFGFGYDADHRLASLTEPGGAALTFVYDSAGRLTARTAGADLTPLTYAPGTRQVASLAGPVALERTYDGALLARETWRGLPGGAAAVTRTWAAGPTAFDLAALDVVAATRTTTAYAYDVDGLLTAAGALALTRDPVHGAVVATTDSTTATTYGFSEYGELGQLTTTIEGAPAFAQRLTRDALGRVTALDETREGADHSAAYAYDAGGRLSRETRDGITTDYAYDAAGRRSSATRAGQVDGAAYDVQDRLTAYGDATFTYTAAGRRATRTDGDGTTQYRYDGSGDLVGVTLPDGREVAYALDGLGRRVVARVGGVVRHTWVYLDGLRPAAELDASGAVTSTFVYGSDRQCPDLIVRGASTYQLVKDHHGSVRLVVEAGSGAVVQRLDYDAFGVIAADSAPGFQPFGFAGGLYDADTGLVHFGAREYDPRVGRWLTKDPTGFHGQATDLYSYANGDPVNLHDPDGKFVVAAVLVVVAVAVIAFGVKQAYDTIEDRMNRGFQSKRAYECGENAVDDTLRREYGQSVAEAGDALGKGAQSLPIPISTNGTPITSLADVVGSALNSILTSL